MKKLLLFTLISLAINAVPNLEQQALNTSLFNAIKDHNLDKVIGAINRGADINAEIMNQSILSWAILHLDGQPNSLVIATLLLDKGARASDTLISAAFSKGASKLAVKIAEKCNADFLDGKKYNFGQSPLHERSIIDQLLSLRDADSLIYLLEKGVAIDNSLIMSVIAFPDSNQNKFVLIQKLIDRGAKVNGIWSISALYFGSPETIKLFLKNGADVNHVFCNEHGISGTYTPLLLAIAYHPSTKKDVLEDVIKALVNAGADIHKRGIVVDSHSTRKYTPLELAFKQGDPKLVELLTGSDS